jgi:hypothetical protein
VLLTLEELWNLPDEHDDAGESFHSVLPVHIKENSMYKFIIVKATSPVSSHWSQLSSGTGLFFGDIL